MVSRSEEKEEIEDGFLHEDNSEPFYVIRHALSVFNVEFKSFSRDVDEKTPEGK